MYVIYLLRWDIKGGSSFYLFLAATLFIMTLPDLHSFYRQIPRAWTLRSYSLYDLVLYLLAMIDLDDAPRVTAFVLVPSLLSISAALAHLRLRSAFLRINALLAGSFADLLFWFIPIAQGMISIWIGVAMGTIMLLLYGGILAAVLLAPMLVTGALRFWSDSQAGQ